MLKETDHDYQGCLVGNFYDQNCSGVYDSWKGFKDIHLGFMEDGFDDTYHFVFRYDIDKMEDSENYRLELCMMLQRKGIYTHLTIRNINQELLNGEVKQWLEERSEYMKSLWKEVL